VWDVDHFKNVNDSVEQWFEPADNALYRAKQEGRKRCEVAQL
jgi:PleD family two-component response regulator